MDDLRNGSNLWFLSALAENSHNYPRTKEFLYIHQVSLIDKICHHNLKNILNGVTLRSMVSPSKQKGAMQLNALKNPLKYIKFTHVLTIFRTQKITIIIYDGKKRRNFLIFLTIEHEFVSYSSCFHNIVGEIRVYILFFGLNE